MRRPLRSGFIKSRLVGFTVTTAASANISVSNGAGLGTFTNNNTDARVDVTLTHPYAQTPFHVCSAGADIIDGSTAGFESDTPTTTTLRAVTRTGAAADDVGTSHHLVWGVDYVQARRSGNVGGLLSEVKGSVRGQTLVTGKVDTDGSKLIGGSVVTTARTSTGTYTVTLDPGFATDPVVVVSPFNAVADGSTARVSATTPNSFTVTTSNAADTLTDTAFYFMALGRDVRDDYTMQQAGPIYTPQREARILGGRVAYSGGTPSTVIPTGEFTLTDVATGELTITFDEPFKREPIVIVTADLVSSFGYASVKASSSTAITVQHASQTGSAADPAFTNFLVVGFDDADEY